MLFAELSRASVEAGEKDLIPGHLATSARDSNLTTPDALDTLGRLAKQTASEFALLVDPADPTFRSRKGGEHDLIRKLWFDLKKEIRIASASDSQSTRGVASDQLRTGFAFPSDTEFADIASLLLDTPQDPDRLKHLRHRTKSRSS